MHRSTAAVALFGAALLGLAPPLGAGDQKGPPEPPPPGPEHERLKELVGIFEARVTILVAPGKPVESTGVANRQMVLNERFLQENYDGSLSGKPFKGFGLTGYDPSKKKYVSMWVDSLSNAMLLTEGTYDTATKTFQNTGDDVDPYTGKRLKARDVLRIVSADEQRLEMYRQAAGAAEYKMVEIRYLRKK